jgi:hypothetical protein
MSIYPLRYINALDGVPVACPIGRQIAVIRGRSRASQHAADLHSHNSEPCQRHPVAHDPPAQLARLLAASPVLAAAARLVRSFANGLGKDRDAVLNGLTLP